jgi:D-psicose/D-tagatose/L-ribulose 3-epimerase
MKFRVCCGIEEAPAVLAAGFDYVEVGASGFGGMSEEWDPSPYDGLPILATNLFFDSRIRLFGPEETPYRDYVGRTVSRAASLGVPLMVIGSGASRRAPEGMDGDAAFIDVVAEVAEIARPFGIEVAPESLNRTETNVGNDLRELATGLLARGVGYTADSYHVLFEWDAGGRAVGLDRLWEQQIPHAPSHVHIADLPRFAPKSHDPMLLGFAERLQALDYRGNVSLECRRDEGFDLCKAISELRKLFPR